jgi:ribulose-phosphate 3-epimerase
MTMVICPSVTPSNPDPHVYREQIERIGFAERVQIDLMDGVFAPNRNLNPIQVWWPDSMLADIHLMYQKPSEQLETLISLKPHLIILHIEADGNIEDYLSHIKRFGIKAGVALLADTPVEQAHGCIELADHVMLFAGKLGSFGGVADLSIAQKIAQIRAIRPDVEIGWDGGVNADNINILAEAGVDVCAVGGYIQRSDDPNAAYQQLLTLLA